MSESDCSVIAGVIIIGSVAISIMLVIVAVTLGEIRAELKKLAGQSGD